MGLVLTSRLRLASWGHAGSAGNLSERGPRSLRRRSRLVRCYREEARASRSLPRACLESAPPSDLGRQRPGLVVAVLAGGAAWVSRAGLGCLQGGSCPVSTESGKATAPVGE